ncbi:hypothetical protein ACYULU_03150 [Breznakiellaceae bacterium SP9]
MEQTFLTEELRYCSPAEPEVLASKKAAIASFIDAQRALTAVKDFAGYKIAELTYARTPKYRYHGMPKDAFHIAALSHRTRLRNNLSTMGINTVERQVYEQRAANLSAAVNAYLSLQEKALA